jgi:hypothetical protein
MGGIGTHLPDSSRRANAFSLPPVIRACDVLIWARQDPSPNRRHFPFIPRCHSLFPLPGPIYR